MGMNSPCNCNQASSLPELGSELAALDTLPSVEVLEADLAAAMAEDALADSEFGMELFASELDPEEELAFAALEGQAAPSLDALVAVLQQNPGLKLTLSF